MFNQHAGFNINLVRDIGMEDGDLALQQAKLMFAIDRVGIKAYWTDADYNYNRKYVDVTMECRMPRDVMHAFLNDLASAWTVDGTLITTRTVVMDIDEYVNENREALRRAAMSGVI